MARNPSVAYLIVRVESKVIFKRGRYTEKNEYLLMAVPPEGMGTWGLVSTKF